MSLVFLSDGASSDAALSIGTTKEECLAKIVEKSDAWQVNLEEDLHLLLLELVTLTLLCAAENGCRS
jgi:hypothetical protein